MICRPSLPSLLPALLAGQYPAGINLPAPQLIIGAGHGTHASLVCARRAASGRSIVLMKPGLPASWFDLCLIPRHDNPPRSDNIIHTEGVLNKIRPSDQQDPARGLVLIGGPSRHFSWDRDSLLNQLHSIMENRDVNWTITDSPRTPSDTRTLLAGIDEENAAYASHQTTGPAWLPQQLAAAGTVWITEDSMSMIYEALTSGAAVGLLETPRKRDDRITRAVDELGMNKMITFFKDWSGGQPLRPPPCALDESRRCAELILERFSL